MSDGDISRRELFRKGGHLAALLTVPALLQGSATEAAAAAAPLTGAAPDPTGSALRVGPNIYQSIGVKPVINGRGTFTIISGSTMLPEVRAAIDAAAQHYVHLDELADAVGQRLATLTGAEFGMVSSGCAAGLTHATAACVAGGNPDLHVRIPNLEGFKKDEAIIPRHSRNTYDAAVRAVGVRVIEVDTVAELEAAIGPRTALIYLLAGPNVDNHPLNTKVICDIAKPKGVPVLVDAAAEILTVPNVHLANGATLVGYSGGKCLRGPQAAGLLLGRKDLIKAAWVHSAPHHGYARGYKVGKEEAIGMLMAVEMWVKRDHDAEWKRWMGWLDTVAKRVSAIDGVTTSVSQPDGLSNKTPSLRILWDPQKLGLTGDAVAKLLLDGDPRIVLPTARGGGPGGPGAATNGSGASASGPVLTGVSVTPYMLASGDDKIIADRLHAILSKPVAAAAAPTPAAPAADLSGAWQVRIQYAAGTSDHILRLAQKGNDVTGTHQGDFASRDLMGTIDGDTVRLRSQYSENGDGFGYSFTGKVSGDQLTGTLDMGEYLGATWTATRRMGGRRRG